MSINALEAVNYVITDPTTSIPGNKTERSGLHNGAREGEGRKRDRNWGFINVRSNVSFNVR